MNPTDTLPINVHYDEPARPGLDIATTIRRGDRIRRRRHALRLSGAALAATGAAAGVLLFQTTTTNHAKTVSSAAGPDFSPIAPFLTAHPPAGGASPTVIGAAPAHWTTVAWLTSDGSFCDAAFRTPSDGTITVKDCGGDDTASTPLGMPVPQVGPLDSASGAAASVPAIGLVRGPAVKVEMTVYGHTYSATVVRVGSAGSTAIGAYEIWFQPPASGAYGPADIQTMTAYDASGRVVATHGPWGE